MPLWPTPWRLISRAWLPMAFVNSFAIQGRVSASSDPLTISVGQSMLLALDRRRESVPNPESVPNGRLVRSYRASSRSSVPGSAPATSSIFTRLRAPATSVTEPRPTPNAAATDASAAAVALPSAARSLTRTTRAPSCSPPTPGRADPGRTRTVMRTPPVCAPSAYRRGVAPRADSDRSESFALSQSADGAGVRHALTRGCVGRR